MRVTKGRILVAIQAPNSDSLVGNLDIRRGIVKVTGTPEVAEEEEVLFGDTFEPVAIEAKSTKRYYLMEIDNVKIIYGKSDIAKENILPFFQKEAA